MSQIQIVIPNPMHINIKSLSIGNHLLGGTCIVLSAENGNDYIITSHEINALMKVRKEFELTKLLTGA